jgi:hypothetical protein
MYVSINKQLIRLQNCYGFLLGSATEVLQDIALKCLLSGSTNSVTLVAWTCSAVYGFHHACVTETIFMELLYLVNKKFLSDHDAVRAWIPTQLLRSIDRLPQHFRQALCYWKSPRPQNMF